MQSVYRYQFRSDRNKETRRKTYELKGKVWLWKGSGTWHFVTLPKSAAKEIRAGHGFNAKGWGSLPVVVEAGPAKWQTSIFPYKKTGSYILPLKADVRLRAGIKSGSVLSFKLAIR